MIEVFIEPSELWDCYEEMLSDDELMESMCKIAENDDYGVSVWAEGDCISAYIIVEIDGAEVFKSHVCDANDAELTAEWVYESFLNYGISDDEIIKNKEIKEREEELDYAFIDLVETIMGESPKKIVDDIKEHVLEYLAIEWGADIYRPSILIDSDTGEEYYTEFPYDDMYCI